jgi:phosphoglycolate phosphatase-like HAD superfamily hydrolase
VDYETAQQAQIPFVFFTGGYRNASAAFFQNAHHIDQFSALPALADSLLKRP